jgi:hypothetical protein
LSFDGFPVANYLARSFGLHIAEYVRMPLGQLLCQPIQHLPDGEMFFFLRHLRVEQHLQQQVAQLIAELREIALVNRLQYFVGFLDGERLDGIESLFAVPGASPGRAQPRHDGDCLLEFFAGGAHSFTVNDSLLRQQRGSLE